MFLELNGSGDRSTEGKWPESGEEEKDQLVQIHIKLQTRVAGPCADPWRAWWALEL